MKLIAVVGLLLAGLAAATAGVNYNNVTGEFTCFPGGGAYCAGDSMTTNIMIHCDDTVGHPVNCNDNLAGVSPVGVKPFAPCYESSLTAGDATCSWNCTAYPTNAFAIELPSEMTPLCFVPASNFSGNETNGVTSVTTGLTVASIAESNGMSTSTCVETTVTASQTPASTTISGQNLAAAISAMTAGGIPMYSPSESSFPSSLSELGPLFSSIVNGTGQVTSTASSTTATASNGTTATSWVNSTTTTLPTLTYTIPGTIASAAVSNTTPAYFFPTGSVSTSANASTGIPTIAGAAHVESKDAKFAILIAIIGMTGLLV